MSTTVTYKGSVITTAENNTKVLETANTWLEDDITLVDVTSGGGGSTLGTKTITQNGTYNATDDNLDGYSEVTVNVPTGSTPTGTKQISITQNGTTTEDVTNYANAEITVNVSGGGGYSIDDLAGGAPTGAITINATSVSAYAFYHKTGITSVSAPNCLSTGQYAFQDCSGITSISFPSLTTFNEYDFQNCTGLTSVAFPSLTSDVRTRTFGGCTNLATADLGFTSRLRNQAFINASGIRTLILRKTDGVVTLDGWTASCLGGIYNNPTASTVYVPQSLLATYQTTGNWVSAQNAGVTFSAIEGSIYE